MFFYNILFYYVYVLGSRNKYNKSDPQFVACYVVTYCFLLNFNALYILLLKFNLLFKDNSAIGSKYSILFVLGFPVIFFLYYFCNRKYLKIYENYKQKLGVPSTLKAIIIMSLYIIISTLLIVLSGLVYNNVI